MITNIGRRNRRKSKTALHEDDHQKLLIKWADSMAGLYPCLSRLFHIPNGGKRTKAEAGIFKAMGVRAGAPDLCLPVARNGYHSLYIELKSETGRVSISQKEWGDFLTEEGNYWVVCKGWVSAAHVIANYLGMPKHTRP